MMMTVASVAILLSGMSLASAASGHRIVLLTDQHQFATPGHLLWEPLLIRVENADGTAAPGVDITFSVGSGDGTFLQSAKRVFRLRTLTLKTDQNGLAEAQFCAPPEATAVSHVSVRIDGTASREGWVIRNVDGSKPPETPVDVTANTEAPNHVVVSWTPGSNNATHYVIERTDDNRIFDTVGAVPATVTRFDDVLAEPSRAYAYRVIAVN